MNALFSKFRLHAWFSRGSIAGVARAFAGLILFAALSLDIAAPWISFAVYISGAEDCSCCTEGACACRRKPAGQSWGLHAGSHCRANCDVVYETQSNRISAAPPISEQIPASAVAGRIVVTSSRRVFRDSDAPLYQRPPPEAQAFTGLKS